LNLWEVAHVHEILCFRKHNLKQETENKDLLDLGASLSQRPLLLKSFAITFLPFEEAQIIGGIVPNLIAFGLFVGAIGYFA